MAIKTKNERITGNVQVWAIPKTRWENERDLEEGLPPFPFNYEIRTDRSWSEGAVCIHTQDIVVELPGGLDLLSAALKTLRDAKREILAEAERKCCEIDEKIQKLALLEYNPDGQ